MNLTRTTWPALIVLLTGLSGCGGGGSSAGNEPITGHPSVVAALRYDAAPAEVCPAGGAQLDTGIDDNANGLLDAAEIDNTQYVCNGTNGAAGLTTLVAITEESAGVRCASGGMKISAGFDTDADNLLDPDEATSTSYICNGAAGQNGTNGTDGLTSLVSVQPEPAGDRCPNGGSWVKSGLDLNGNKSLEDTEVTSSSYVCSGAQGSSFNWVEITTDVQALPDTGYITNSAARITVTLPAAPVIGDVVRVTGLGSGGWKVAQNAGQTVMTRSLSDWTLQGAGISFPSIASSADGTKLLVATGNGPLFTSIDAGVTWTERETPRSWTAVASSADGTKLVAAERGVCANDISPYCDSYLGGQLYTSTDSGATWTARETARLWSSVASSADGTKLVAAVNGGLLYTSTDSGVTWTQRETPRNWTSVASSADGTTLVAADAGFDDPTCACDVGGQLYTSTDSGATWTARAATHSYSVASSADGTKLVAVGYYGIYTSTDSGVTWTLRSAPRAWLSVASSADGLKLLAANSGGQLYTSTDAGLTWTGVGAPNDWKCVASSADGTRLAAGTSDGMGNGAFYTSILSTTAGVNGAILGGQFEAIELQYLGNNTFTVLSHDGNPIVQ